MQNYPGHKKAKKVPVSVDFLEIRMKKKSKKADYQFKIEAQLSFNKTIIYIEEN